MKYSLYLCLVTSALLSSFVLAEEASAKTYACQHNGIERTIKVIYDNPGSQVPCQVVYEKESATQTLWRAENELNYCEAKAESFVTKQQGWGWDCAELASEPKAIPEQ